MPNTKLTREKLNVHFHYSRMIYVGIIIVAIMVGSLAFTMTAYHAPNERRVDVELIGGYVSATEAELNEAEARLLAAGVAWETARDAAQGTDTAAGDYEPALQEVDILSQSYDPASNSDDNYYAAQKYMVTLAAQEGDIYVLPRVLMTQLADDNTLVPLDDYIESGVIDPGDRDLGKCTFDEMDDDNQPTGRQCIYALQADSLTGMIDGLGFDPTGKYLVIMQFSKNQDTAAAVLQELINMYEPAETEAGNAGESEAAK